MMEVNNTLLLVGVSRTGTRSLWTFLGQHPNIHPSNIKEPIKQKNFKPSNYLDHWDLSKIKDGDILLDGSPGWWRYDFMKELTSKFRRVCCIFIIRRPYTKLWASRILLHYKLLMNKELTKSYEFDSKGKIKEEPVISKIKSGLMDELTRLETMTGKQNIFILGLDYVEKYQSNIYDFLSIDNTVREKFNHLNRTPQHVLTLDNVDQIFSFVKTNKELIDKEEKIDIKNIKEKYIKQVLII